MAGCARSGWGSCGEGPVVIPGRREVPSPESINPQAQLAILRIQINPLRILLFYKPDFPFPPPLLQFLLACDRSDGIVVDLEPHQPADRVSFAEPGNNLALMLVSAADNIVRRAKIERAVLLAGEEVNVIGHEQLVKWIPGSALLRRPGMTNQRCHLCVCL
jgi:hypothetical protein